MLRLLKSVALALGITAILSAPGLSATLGLATGAPTIGATGTADYLEFGPDGDLSVFGATAFVSNLTTLDVSSAEIEFAVGFDLANPEDDASGGFAVFDASGLYLSGDLIDLGQRSVWATGGLVELWFGNLTGRGASEWTPSLIMGVIFSGTNGDPLPALVDGDFYDVELGVFAVTTPVPDPNPNPAPIPLPASAWLLLLALGGLGLVRTPSSR